MNTYVNLVKMCERGAPKIKAVARKISKQTIKPIKNKVLKSKTAKKIREMPVVDEFVKETKVIPELIKNKQYKELVANPIRGAASGTVIGFLTPIPFAQPVGTALGLIVGSISKLVQKVKV